jgi:hypothetical protein
MTEGLWAQITAGKPNSVTMPLSGFLIRLTPTASSSSRRKWLATGCGYPLFKASASIKHPLKRLGYCLAVVGRATDSCESFRSAEGQKIVLNSLGDPLNKVRPRRIVIAFGLSHIFDFLIDLIKSFK